MAISNLNSSYLVNPLAISSQQYGVNPFSPVKQKSESDDVFAKMNSLDGSFNANREKAIYGSNRVEAPIGTTTAQPQEKIKSGVEAIKYERSPETRSEEMGLGQNIFYLA